MNSPAQNKTFVMPQEPHGIENKSNYCYSLSVIQALFCLEDVQHIVTMLDDDDPLKKIAKEYATKEYIKAEVFAGLSNEILKHQGQADAVTFFEKLLELHDSLYKLFSFDASTVIGAETVRDSIKIINMEPSQHSVQLGVDHQIESGNIFNIENSPDYLAIYIPRISGRGTDTEFDKSNVEINNFLKFNSELYQLKSIICHSGYKTTSGHFITIAKYSSTPFYINQNSVLKELPTQFSNTKIQQKAVLLFYQKNNGVAYNETIFIMPTKKISSSYIKSSETIGSSAPNVNKLNQNHPLYLLTPDASKLLEIPDVLHNQPLDKTYKLMDHPSDNYINLHDQFKYLHGTLDVDDNGAPNFLYATDKRAYQKDSDLLQLFTSCLSNIKFNYNIKNGEVNASIIADHLEIEALIASDEQIVACATAVDELFNYYLKQKVNPAKDILITKLQEILLPFQSSLQYEQEPQSYSSIQSEEEDQFIALGEKYNYLQRIDDLAIQPIVEQITSILESENELKKNTEYQEKSNQLKQKMFEEYTLVRDKISKKEFVQSFIQKRNETREPTALTYDVNYAYKLLIQFDENEGIIPTKARGGNNSVVNKDIILCLVATVFDFPEATDKERTMFVNKYGPAKQNNISVSTVNRILNKLKFTTKKPAFSPAQRNCFGYRVARVIWSRYFLKLINSKNNLIVFIDEAGVVLKGSNKARGFASITPCVEKALTRKSMSVLACIVPGFGTIVRFYNKAVNAHFYAEFLKDVVFILRTKICSKTTQIIVINDNCKIHKKKIVYDNAKEYDINLFFTVPYSPHLNILAENFFGQMKFLTLYNKSINDTNLEELMVPQTNKGGLYTQKLIQLWCNAILQHYNGESTKKIYKMWLNILDLCSNGKPLSGDHIDDTIVSESSASISLRGFQCYRK